MKKKLAVLLLSFTVLVMTFTGCNTKTPTKTTKNIGLPASEKVTLTVYGAGTLSEPFKEVDSVFKTQYPAVTIQPQFGGSVKMVKQVTELNQIADIIGVADYNVIPKYMFGGSGKKAYTDWYIGFATNSLTFVYTDKSKGHNKINSKNWYKVLAEKGVQIGRSNPDTDPSGYQTLQVLNLAAKYYKDPKLVSKILANSPKANIRDTETELLSALEAGQIDYLAIYKSDAIQHKLKYIDLPPEINLSDTKYANTYKQAKVVTKNGTLTGSPIVYAVTVPNNANNAVWARKYISFLLSPIGKNILKKDGFGVLSRPYANDTTKIPSDLSKLVVPWPSK